MCGYGYICEAYNPNLSPYSMFPQKRKISSKRPVSRELKTAIALESTVTELQSTSHGVVPLAAIYGRCHC